MTVLLSSLSWLDFVNMSEMLLPHTLFKQINLVAKQQQVDT